jgi:hypothetical protein
VISGHVKAQPAKRSALPASSSIDEEDLDPLFEADENALDELLENLDLDGDVPPEQPPRWTYDAEEETRKVAALLEELQTPSKTEEQDSGEQGKSEDRDDDDSDGEQMSKEVNEVMSQALDDVELERSLSLSPSEKVANHTNRTPEGRAAPPRSSQGEKSPTPPTHPQDGDTGTHPKPETARKPTSSGDRLDLPTVPSVLQDPAPSKDDSLTLPAVPSDLRDPVPPTDDFESDITARMAKLSGLGVDSFGLPSAPSFNPDTRPSPGTQSSYKKVGYTDEDQKTWCIVCLDDATIRCVGCDNDVYCARCWKDMHVGPSAGWDERGHQWVKFDAREVR